MAKKKTKKKSHNKSRATLTDLTAEYTVLAGKGRQPLSLKSIYRKVHGEMKLRFRDSKGKLTTPNKRSKIRYELVDKESGKIIYKGNYKKFKRIPSLKQIVKTAGNYIKKGKGRAWQSAKLKEGKDKNTVEIEFETP